MAIATRFLGGDEGKFAIHRRQDCSPILEHCHALRESQAVGSADMKLAATFPQVAVENYLAVNNVSWHEFLQNPEHANRMMNDPALSKFRIWEGQV